MILRRYIYRPEWRGEGEELNIPSRHLGREGDDGKEEGGKEKKTKKKINSPIEILLDRAEYDVDKDDEDEYDDPPPPPTSAPMDSPYL